MSTDDHMETITDPAEIRATDEPDERGDFPCCTTPAPVGDAVALDLDAMARRYSTATDDEVIYEMYPALEAEACRLTERADHKSALAADNARRAEVAEAEVVTLRARLAAVEDLHWKVGGACSHCSQRSDYAVAWPCETAVALAGTTGEGE